MGASRSIDLGVVKECLVREGLGVLGNGGLVVDVANEGGGGDDGGGGKT